MQAQAEFSIAPLMRPRQVEDAKEEIKSAEAKLQSPHIEDKGEVAKQLRRLRKNFAEQAPQAPASGEEEGHMVARSEQLLSEILRGMPSQEEMRKAPPGAVDKHMKWEARNKAKILEWRNLRLRLTHGEESEAANLERHRPVGSTLNMDGAIIQGRQYFMPPLGAGAAVAFSDEQLALLRALNPDLAERVGLLSNPQRAEVKQVLSQAQIDGARGPIRREELKREAMKKPKKYKRKTKRVLSPEHLAALNAGRIRKLAENAAPQSSK